MKTKRAKIIDRLIFAACILPLIALSGCASSYDCYTCGRVNCSYCPPKPLPSLEYESCNCNDSIGQAYLANLPSFSYVDNVSANVRITPIIASNLDYYLPEVDPKNGKNVGLHYNSSWKIETGAKSLD